MLPGMKKALATASSTYPQLASVIYDEKVVAETLEKWIDAKKQALATRREWAKVEDKLLRDMFTCLEEANDIDMNVYTTYIEKHNQCRKIYKDILTDKMMYDDMKKQSEQLDNRVHKMFKSYESVQRKKNDPCRTSMAHEELKKALKAKEEFHIALDNRKDEINLLTLQRVRHNLLDMIDATSDLHRAMLSSLEEQRKLVDLYLPDDIMVEVPNLTKAQITSSKILSGLTDKLRMPRPLSRSDVYAGVSFQAFRYIPDKELVLSPSFPSNNDQDGRRRRSNSLGIDLDNHACAAPLSPNFDKLLSPHHLKPLPAPRPAHSLTDLTNIGENLYVKPERAEVSDSDSDYEYNVTGPYLSLVKEEDEISPTDASNLYERMSDWLSKQSPRSSFERSDEFLNKFALQAPPLPQRNEREKRKPPKPPVKPRDIHKRLEFLHRQRSHSAGTIESKGMGQEERKSPERPKPPEPPKS